MTVARAGTSSVTFAVVGRLRASGTQAFIASATNVFVDNTIMKPVPIPARYRRTLDYEAAQALARKRNDVA